MICFDRFVSTSIFNFLPYVFGDVLLFGVYNMFVLYITCTMLQSFQGFRLYGGPDQKLSMSRLEHQHTFVVGHLAGRNQ